MMQGARSAAGATRVLRIVTQVFLRGDCNLEEGAWLRPPQWRDGSVDLTWNGEVAVHGMW
jgi:hypothetical protein